MVFDPIELLQNWDTPDSLKEIASGSPLERKIKRLSTEEAVKVQRILSTRDEYRINHTEHELLRQILNYVQDETNEERKEMKSMWTGCYYQESEGVWWINRERLHRVTSYPKVCVDGYLNKLGIVPYKNDTNDSEIDAVIDKLAMKYHINRHGCFKKFKLVKATDLTLVDLTSPEFQNLKKGLLGLELDEATPDTSIDAAAGFFRIWDDLYQNDEEVKVYRAFFQQYRKMTNNDDTEKFASFLEYLQDETAEHSELRMLHGGMFKDPDAENLFWFNHKRLSSETDLKTASKYLVRLGFKSHKDVFPNRLRELLTHYRMPEKGWFCYAKTSD